MSMSASATHKVSLKAPTLKKDGNFQTWKTRMNGFLDIHGLAYCLERVDPELPVSSNAVIDSSTDERKSQLKAKQDNNYTIAYVQAAMEDDDDMITML